MILEMKKLKQTKCYSSDVLDPGLQTNAGKHCPKMNVLATRKSGILFVCASKMKLSLWYSFIKMQVCIFKEGKSTESLGKAFGRHGDCLGYLAEGCRAGLRGNVHLLFEHRWMGPLQLFPRVPSGPEGEESGGIVFASCLSFWK